MNGDWNECCLSNSMKENHQIPAPETPEKRNFLKDIGMVVAGLVAVVYLLNPDAGIIELIPDNIPVIGNLDEVAATILLFKVLGHFGWSPFKIRRRKKQSGQDK